MAIVPRLRQQVDISPLPGVRQRAFETPDSLGAQAAEAEGRSAAQIGEAVSRTAGTVYGLSMDEIKKARDEANQAAVLHFENQLSDLETKLIWDPENGALTKNGADAMQLPEAVQDAYQKGAADIGATARTPEQQQAFDRLTQQRWDRINGLVTNHVYQQAQGLKKDALESRVSNGVTEAIRLATVDPVFGPGQFSSAMADTIATLRANKNFLGLSDDGLKSRELLIWSKAHDGAITSLLNTGQVGAAQAWFANAKAAGQVTPETVESVERVMRPETDKVEGQRLADEAIAKFKTYDEQEQWIIDHAKGDVRSVATALIDHNWTKTVQVKQQD
jgi:hypothetical protein